MNKVLHHQAAWNLAILLGCSVSVWSASLDCEMARLGNTQTPDLRFELAGKDELQVSALTPDGEAFLELAEYQWLCV